METNLYKSVKNAVKYWWVSLLIGLLSIILGIWCMTTPDTTLVAISIVFVVGFIVSGIFEIIFAISNKDVIDGWGWTLASGIIDLVLGIILVTLPIPVIATVLIYFVGFWIMFRSIWAIGTAFELKQYGVKGWGWFLALAIAAMLFSIVFILSPVISGAFIIALVSVSFLLYGVFRIYLAFKYKSLYDDMKN